ncbi:MAG: SUMF1/EgtB/PvdO family nonheme iron enzyme [Opitutales bacterium]|nr:SUMF1/EgtB/PvdO family nonheme iron enzyme [Opitutales bacterium]
MAYTSIIKDFQFHPGDMVGDYAILRCLRNGLLGGLYHARDGRDGSVYLVLILPDALTREPSPLEAIKEASAKLAKAKANSLLAPDLVEMNADHLFLRFPLVEGISLADYLSKAGHEEGLPEDVVAFFLDAVSEAVGAANLLGIPHLALCPEDVVVTKSGEVKVLGFGIFSALHRRRFEMYVSTAIIPLAESKGRSAFTPVDSISPEIRNGEAGGEQSDVFALGLLGHYMFTGQRVGRDEWRLTERRDDIAPGWEILLCTASEGKPVDRYASVDIFRRDLANVADLTQASVKKRDPDSGEEIIVNEGERTKEATESAVKKRSWRRPLLLGAALVALGAFGATQVLPWLESPSPPPQVKSVLASSRADANVFLRVQPGAGSGRVLSVRSPPFSFSGGEVALELPRGAHRIRIEADGFAAAEADVSVGADPLRVSIELEPEWGRLRVTGTPGAGLFSLSEERAAFVETVPDDGVLSVEGRLLAMEHDLELRLEGYLPRRFEGVRLRAGEWTELDGQLDEAPGSLSILADRSGVPVEVDGALRGRTPLEVKGLAVARPVTVRVGGGDWRIVEREVTLGRGESRVLHFGSLEAASGQLTVRLVRDGELPSAEVLDGFRARIGEVAVEGKAEFRREVGAGRGTVVVEHPDFRTLTLTYDIADGEEKLLLGELVGRPARLRIEGDFPRDDRARILLDGEARRGVPQIIELASDGETRVTLAVRDHEPITKVFALLPNEETTWTPRLERLRGPESGEGWTVPYLAYTFAWVPPGTGRIGSPLAERSRLPNEGPLTEVVFRRGFWMATHETTQVLFEHITGENPSRFAGARHPVDSVTWSQAMEFCRLLNEREGEAGRLPTGYEYRLPTEAEWEYAARSGNAGPFHWGGTASAANANFKGRYPREAQRGVAEIVREDTYGTVEVGNFPPNAYGLYDMHGNVREWTMDFFNDRLPGGRVEPFFRESGSRGRVVRGGGWEDFAFRARAAARERASPEIPSHATGFRVVLAPKLD